MLKPALQLRLGQQLTMTPQLQQAIKLLQLPVLELQAQVQQALEIERHARGRGRGDSRSRTPLEPEQAADRGEPADERADAEEEVIVEMVDPWSRSIPRPAGGQAQRTTTTTGRSSSPTSAGAICTST